MGDERTDANHFGLEALDEPNVFYQMVDGLSGTSYHDARTGLITDNLQPFKAKQTMVPIHFRRMQFPVMCFVECFVTKQITGGSRFEKPLVGSERFLSQ